MDGDTRRRRHRAGADFHVASDLVRTYLLPVGARSHGWFDGGREI